MGQRYGVGEKEIVERVEEKYIIWLKRRTPDYLVRDELQRGRAERKAGDLKRSQRKEEEVSWQGSAERK